MRSGQTSKASPRDHRSIPEMVSAVTLARRAAHLKAPDMTQAEIETELRALRSELDAHAARAKARDIEWRRLGLIAKASSILSSLAGFGFIIASLVVSRTRLTL